MARAQDQKRWRENTRHKRIEVYMSPENVERLDTLAVQRGQSRATVLASLIHDATPAALATAEPAPPAVSEPVSSGEPTPDVTQAVEPSTSEKHGFRRPRSADEKKYDWIITTGGQRIALGPDPARFWRWSGRNLDGSMFTREAKGNTREEVIRKLLNLPVSTGS